MVKAKVSRQFEMSGTPLFLAARLAAATMLLALSGCGASQGSETETGAADSVPPAAGAPGSEFIKVVNVETATVEATDFTTYVRLTGMVEANSDVTVSAEETGVLTRFFVAKGSRVRAGQALAKIDDQVLASQVEETRAMASLAAERYERQRQLWEDEQIGSEMAYLQAKFDADAAAARLTNLEARLARTTLRAPISGVFDQRFVDAGEMVTFGLPVLRVIDTDRLKIVGGVPERFSAYVSPGGAARVTFDVFNGQVFEGTIGYVGAAVDEANRTFPIEIVMANPGGVIKPQMVANVEAATATLEGVIVVPQEALLRTENGYQVFVATGEGDELVAEPRVVRTGPSFENRIVIEEGLSAGDRLIVVGHQLVDPGDHVRVVDPVGSEG